MALVYFDASALVKLVVEEDGSDLAARLWDGCDAALSSRLGFVEVHAALAASHRNGHLARPQLEAALDGFDRFWAAIRAVELDAAVQRRAGELALAHGLRGADAIHLATALAIGDPELVVAAWDRRLAIAAREAGLWVAPPPS